MIKISFLVTSVFFSNTGLAQKEYSRFNIKDLVDSQQKSNNKGIGFLTKNTLTVKLAFFDKDHPEESACPHDAVFYVIQGKARLKSGNGIIDIEKDSMLFVPGNTSLFFDVENPLIVIKLASLGIRDTTRLMTEVFSLDKIAAGRSSGNNVWNPFIRCASMTFGLYMLPKKLNGDSSLTHRWDEVNVVTHGSGKFQVGSEVMDVGCGDIIYVRKGNPHFFHTLNDGLDILIFFEKKSLAL